MTHFSRTCRDDGWFAKYRNDSRPWLTGNTDSGTPQKYPLTTMKESFPTYQDPPKPEIGRRRELLEKFLLQEVAEEMKQELMKEPEDEKRDTEYVDQFQKDGFDPACVSERTEKDLENHLRYPLYLDAPKTMWLDKFDTLPGKTESSKSQPISVFHRNNSFTKPINQVLDKQKPGTIGYV